ncbi:MAG: hypothetical protein ACI9E1_001498 [Cryomorphaceae bacterium]|jgi:hypothetical protein
MKVDKPHRITTGLISHIFAQKAINLKLITLLFNRLPC